MSSKSLVDLQILEPIVAGYGDHAVLSQGEETITYDQLLTSVKKMARSRHWDACSDGDIVPCIVSDSIDAVVVFFALIYRGLVPCFLNTNLSHSAYADYIKACHAQCVVIEDDLFAVIREQCQEESWHFINVNHLVSEENSKANIVLPSIDGDSIAFALFTSGTTGRPSLVLHRHSDVSIMYENYGKSVLTLKPDDKLFATSRFYFAYGLNALFFTLLAKAHLVIAPKQLTPQVVWDIIKNAMPTVLFSVPSMFQRLLDVASSTQIHSESLRLSISAGETLPIKLHKSWEQKTSTPILDGIGTTEILSTFISNTIDKNKAGTTGYAVPGFEYQIRDTESDVLVKPGEKGILWIKGDTYVDYYPNNQQATKERFVDGWFKTNDIFSQTPQGEFIYHGRANDLIKVSGIWVYPYKIENIILQHPDVKEAVVIGINVDGFMRTQAYIVLKPAVKPSSQLSEAIKSMCKERCAKHEYPQFIRYVASLPRTSTGKLQRFKLANT